MNPSKAGYQAKAVRLLEDGQARLSRSSANDATLVARAIGRVKASWENLEGTRPLIVNSALQVIAAGEP